MTDALALGFIYAAVGMIIAFAPRMAWIAVVIAFAGSAFIGAFD